MSTQAALKAKEDGIARVAANNEEFLKVARALAKQICHEQGDVTADDIRQRLTLLPLHFNAYGAIFKHPDFITNGDTRTSTQVQGHGNANKVWRLACAN